MDKSKESAFNKENLKTGSEHDIGVKGIGKRTKLSTSYKVIGLREPGVVGGHPGGTVNICSYDYRMGNGDPIGYDLWEVIGPQFLPRSEQRSLDEIEVDGAIIIINNNKIKSKNMKLWIRDLMTAHGPEIPIVVWEIRSDYGATSVSQDGNIQHCVTDATRGLEVPFQYLARVLTGNNNLVLQ